MTYSAQPRRPRPFRPCPILVPPDLTSADGLEGWLSSPPTTPPNRTDDDDAYAFDLASWFLGELVDDDPKRRPLHFISAAEALAPVDDALIKVTLSAGASIDGMLNRFSSGGDSYEFAFRDLLAAASRLGLNVTVAIAASPSSGPAHEVTVYS